MKRTVLLTFLLAVCLGPAGAQTLGQALSEIETTVQAIIARYPSPSTWGEQTSVDDLKRFLAQTQRLGAGLGSDDADSVEELQRGFSSAGRRAQTSVTMLSPQDQESLAGVSPLVDQVDNRLTDLRLRFGSKATLVGGTLADMPLTPDQDFDSTYANVNELLIDVRDARRLASTLGNIRFPQQGFGFGQPNNLDGLQLQRLLQAGWELERQLSVQIPDVSVTLPAWQRFEREYNRIGYPGTNTNIRQLDRVMRRLGAFYDQYRLEPGQAQGKSDGESDRGE